MSRHGVGGTAIFAYRSESLRRTLEDSIGDQREAGDLYVVVVLDSEYERAEVPLAVQRFDDNSNLKEAMFTVAIVLNQPWSQRSR
jgi:hypothetical protein